MTSFINKSLRNVLWKFMKVCYEPEIIITGSFTMDSIHLKYINLDKHYTLINSIKISNMIIINWKIMAYK